MEESATRLVDTLSPELLIKVFSYLENSGDLSQVARTCRLWSQVLQDEQLWRTAFIQQLAGGKEQLLSTLNVMEGHPSSSMPVPAYWRTRFMSKIRSKRLWSGGHQLAFYRFKDLGADNTGTIEAVRLTLDSRSLHVSSLECLLHGMFTQEATLRRSTHYYSRTFDEEARVSAVSLARETGAMAIGLEDSSLIIYERTPVGSLGKNYQRKLLVPPATNNQQRADRLPVQRIEWISPSRVMVLCRKGDFPASLLFSCDIFEDDRHGVRAISSKLNINCWAFSESNNEKVYWSSGGLACGEDDTKWGIPCFDKDIDSMVLLSDRWLLATSQSSSDLITIDCEKGRLVGKISLGTRIRSLVHSTAGVYAVAATEDAKLYVIRCVGVDVDGVNVEE